MQLPAPLLGSGFSFGVDLIAAIQQTDFVGLVCLLILFVMSLASGYFIVSKFTEVRSARRQSEDFIADCMEGHKSLPEIYRSAKDYPDSPLAAMLREAYLEYEMEVRTDNLAHLPLQERVQLGKTSVESALERTISAEMRKLEGRLVYLATISSLAPFIGLFGTVWGVLGAFQALGRDGSAALATLAPGISTALVTTVAGLVVAIPAAAIYNILSGNVSRLSSQMDSFAHELSNVFQKHLLRRGIEG